MTCNSQEKNQTISKDKHTTQHNDFQTTQPFLAQVKQKWWFLINKKQLILFVEWEKKHDENQH